MSLNVDAWLDAYRVAWETRDPEAAVALFTEDATYLEEPYAEPFVGRAGVRDYWTRVTATQEDVEFRTGETIVAGSRAAVEWWVTLRNGGADVTLAGEFWLEFDDAGLCRTLREYWHYGEGRRTPPATWGK
jgi:ketosteroid isomerase-like protein